MICLCYKNGSYDCNKSILGPVYPGQVLQLRLCTPCSDNTFILYANMYDSLQTNVSCRITNPTEILNTISDHTKSINYIIVSEASNICKFFLAIYSHQHATCCTRNILLSCPVDSHYKMKYVIVILSLQNTLICARLLSDLLLILGLLQLTKQIILSI